MAAEVRARDAERDVDAGPGHGDHQDAAEVGPAGIGRRLKVGERRPDRRVAVHVEPHAADVGLVEDGRRDQLDCHGPGLGGGEGDGVRGRRAQQRGPTGSADALEPGPGLGLEERLAPLGPGARGVRREPVVDAGPAVPARRAAVRADGRARPARGTRRRRPRATRRAARRRLATRRTPPALERVDRVEEDRFARLPLERAEGDGDVPVVVGRGLEVREVPAEVAEQDQAADPGVGEEESRRVPVGPEAPVGGAASSRSGSGPTPSAGRSPGAPCCVSGTGGGSAIP